MRRLTALKALRLADTGAEEVRRNHGQAIAEIQALVERDIINDVVLEPSTETRVPHRLGRTPQMVVVSPIFDGSSSNGRILEIRTSNDRAKAIVLYATGFTTAITVDVQVL